MNDLHNRCLDTFPEWLRTLAADATELSELLGADASDEARRYVTGGLNYLFKSLDLIPDGIEDLGFIDDAFVLRVAASLALAAGAVPEGASATALRKLAEDSDGVKDFLGDAYPRLETYVRGLSKGAARGRTVDEILADVSVRDGLVSEVGGWASSYEAPTFTRDEKTLVKLKSFLDTKLPR